RGNRSISGDSQPLYVVDGVPIRGNPSDISPDDVASINVLKGPNAAALYGSAAQNGAIVIDTRRAEAGVVNLSLSNTFTVLDPVHTVQYQDEFGQGAAGQYDRTSESSWGPRMDGQTVRHWSPDPTRTNETYSMTPQPSNNRDIFQRGYNNATNLSASIGGDRTQTLFSYTFTDAQGILETNTLERHNVSVRVSSDLTERLTLDSRLAYMRQDVNTPITTRVMRNVYKVPRNIPIEQMRELQYIDGEAQTRQHYWLPGSNGGTNPLWAMHRRPVDSGRERVMSLASLTYDITESVSLMARAAYDGVNTTYERRLWNDDFGDGQYQMDTGNSLEWNGDFLLSYTEDLSDEWSVDANVGGNLKQRRNSSLSANTGSALLVPNHFTLLNSNDPSASQSLGSPSDIQSLYSFGQVGWRDAIYLDVSARNDWSSTLPADSRSYFYPSVGLTTVISDMMEMPDILSLARLRASYAQVGNSAPVFAVHRTAEIVPGGTGGYLVLDSDLPNENLKPEITESFELGLDMRFYQGRLGLDVTAYKMNTRDQLFTVALPASSGAARFFTNGGDVENKGIEALLTTRPVQTTRFSWDLDFNFGLNRNMVVKISDERPQLTIADDYLRDVVIEEGKPYGQVYSVGFLRNDDGDVIVASDGTPRLTPGKTVQVANFQPDWTGGITSSFSYRNFAVSFLIDHRQGGTIVSGKQAELYEAGVTEATLAGRDGTTLVFGDNFYSDYTAVMDDGSPNTTPVDPEVFWRSVGGINSPAGEPFIESATNTRLRELTVGYNLPQSVLGQLPFSNVKVSLVGRNLFFIYKATDDLDPDLMSGTNPAAEGFESAGAPPTTRSIGANIKLDF
ncbi:MAG: SusC/RagA family TonB-linked outer membrane protein, partial [Balneolaceae bacterium]